MIQVNLLFGKVKQIKIKPLPLWKKLAERYANEGMGSRDMIYSMKPIGIYPAEQI